MVQYFPYASHFTTASHHQFLSCLLTIEDFTDMLISLVDIVKITQNCSRLMAGLPLQLPPAHRLQLQQLPSPAASVRTPLPTMQLLPSPLLQRSRRRLSLLMLSSLKKKRVSRSNQMRAGTSCLFPLLLSSRSLLLPMTLTEPREQ